MVHQLGPLVKWPKTPASHAGNTSSNLVRVTNAVSAAGLRRIYSSIAQSVEHAAVNRGVVGSSPTGGAIFVVRKSYNRQKAQDSAYLVLFCYYIL